MRFGQLAASLLSVLLASTVAAQPPAPRSIAIRAGLLVDPATGRAERDQVILVDSGVVRAVGRGLAIPAGAQVIDLSQSSVLPGLMDAHTHLCMNVRMDRDAASYYYTTLNDAESARAVDGVVNARAMLRAGFTAVRDVGNEGNHACQPVMQAIQAGRIPGPAMLTAGRIIAPYGGQFTMQPHKGDALASPEYLFADTRDQMVRAIRENAHYGAGLIKIVIDDQRYIYSTDDIRFMVDEARRAGLKLTAHAWTREGAHNAVAVAGLASIEHLNGVSDEDIAVAKRNGIVGVFTPFPQWVLRQFRGEQRAAVEYADEISRLRAGIQAGMTIAFGTDAIHALAGHDRGTQAISWIDGYIEAGMTPAALLRSMTSIPATLFGIADRRGAIRPGMAADLIATPADPLTDVQTLKKVHFVMKDGVVFRHDPRP
jgi:imidazolonepropionase-like amidohydrolase